MAKASLCRYLYFVQITDTDKRVIVHETFGVLLESPTTLERGTTPVAALLICAQTYRSV